MLALLCAVAYARGVRKTLRRKPSLRVLARICTGGAVILSLLRKWVPEIPYPSLDRILRKTQETQLLTRLRSDESCDGWYWSATHRYVVRESQDALGDVRATGEGVKVAAWQNGRVVTLHIQDAREFNRGLIPLPEGWIEQTGYFRGDCKDPTDP